MTYNPSIPQSGDDPTVSQAQLLANFGVLNTATSVNHIPLTSGANPGLHTMINFPVALASDPNLAAPISSLYPKLSGSANQLFFQNGNSSANVVQLTGLPITSAGTLYGFTTPWGWIVNMGTVSAGTAVTITFQVPLSAGFTVYTAQMTLQSTSVARQAVISNITQTQMTYTASTNAYFLVIGS